MKRLLISLFLCGELFAQGLTQKTDVRILYERYREQLRTHTGKSQRVLFPEVVQFPPSDNMLLERLLPELEAVGFDLSPLGRQSYAVNGIPAGLEGINVITLLQGIVAAAAEQTAGAADEISHSLALSMARTAAIPQGQILSNEEMESLVNQLFACSNVNFTPDGKTILAILPQRDIEQLLG